MKATITRTLLRDLPPPTGGVAKVRIFDDRLVGFVAEQRRSGVTFYFRYSDPRGRSREVKLGRHADVTVEQARRQAEQLKASVSMGADPVAEKNRKRAVPTFESFARERYLPHVKERLRSASDLETYLRLRILPSLGKKALDEINQDDVAALRRKLLATKLSPSTINRHLATVRAMFNLALRWELYEGRNPARSPGMLRENQRDRYLNAEQTQALVRALDASKCPDSAAALALLVVTGGRKQEILRATWEHVDLERAMLTVPRSKSGKARHIPLSPYAVAVLRRQFGKRADACVHVFPSKRRPGKPLGDLRKTWDTVKKAAGLPADLHIHDLRHSFASALANAGIPLFEIGTVLGHSQLSTTSRYAHHAPERLVATAATATRAWNLLPTPEEA